MSHSEGELCAVAERRVVWTVHWGLSGKPGVKLAHVLVRLLRSHRGDNEEPDFSFMRET